MLVLIELQDLNAELNAEDLDDSEQKNSDWQQQKKKKKKKKGKDSSAQQGDEGAEALANGANAPTSKGKGAKGGKGGKGSAGSKNHNEKGKEERSTDDLSMVLCYKCQKLGHYANSCPEKGNKVKPNKKAHSSNATFKWGDDGDDSDSSSSAATMDEAAVSTIVDAKFSSLESHLLKLTSAMTKLTKDAGFDE